MSSPNRLQRLRAAGAHLSQWATGMSPTPERPSERTNPLTDLIRNSHAWTSVAVVAGGIRPGGGGNPQRSQAGRPGRAAGLIGAAALAALALPLVALPNTSATSSGGVRAVLVRADAGQLSAVEDAVRRLGGHVGRELRLIDAVAATIPRNAGPALAAAFGVREVTDNARVTLAEAPTSPSLPGGANPMWRVEQAVGARQMWSRGFTGQGVDVALVDSGVAPVAGIPASNLVYGPDLTPESQATPTVNIDGFGHGTHMAGIIAGHDPVVSDVTRAIGDHQNFLGVAPNARVISVKVADSHGLSDVSQVIAGIDWVVTNAHTAGLNIRVMNLSFGTDSAQAYASDPLAYAAEQAWRHGIVVVVSAGNTGAASGRMTDPATDPFVLAVGADNNMSPKGILDDTIPPFSASGDGVRNPDLIAPGTHVESLRVPGGYAERRYGIVNSGRFARGSGTSQSAAVVSGAAALLLQRSPTLTPDQVKYLLVGNARKLPAAPPQAQGAGLLSMRNIGVDAPPAVQTFAPATGSGTLEGSRGSTHLMLRNPSTGVSTPLTGEVDLFGASVDTPALAASEATATSWTGGRWNGNPWAGESWVTGGLSSSSWASRTWASSAWASSAWASSAWASSAWASSAWASSAWASSAWASSAWASSAWASSYWADASWS